MTKLLIVVPIPFPHLTLHIVGTVITTTRLNPNLVDTMIITITRLNPNLADTMIITATILMSNLVL